MGIFQAQKVGSWWGHYRDKETNERKEIEIDIVALNKNTNEILFGECKWKKDVDGENLLRQLKEKTKYVEWPDKQKKENRKECYLLLAKSFRKKMEEKGVYCFDLEDISKALK
jgi:hypothetical protein